MTSNVICMTFSIFKHTHTHVLNQYSFYSSIFIKTIVHIYMPLVTYKLYLGDIYSIYIYVYFKVMIFFYT